MRKQFLFSLALLLLLNAGAVSFAQDDPSAEQPAPQKIVTGIEIKGNKSISTNTIISKMRTKIGAPYQETVISDDLKRLYLLGYFSDIKIDTEDYKNGLRVVIRVEERPIISKITFQGIFRITLKDEKIKEQLKSKEGQYLDYPNLTEDVSTLKKMYEKIGFSQADVEYAVDLDQATNRAKVQFNISENKKVVIKEIKIEGNKAFSDIRIIRLMKTRPAWLFNAGVLKDDVLAEDAERVKSFYNKEGFADASVEYSVQPDAKKRNFLVVVLKVNEGKQYLVGDVTIKGNKDVTEKEIVSRLSDSLPGKVFSQDALKKDVTVIQALYFDRGYISVRVQEVSSLNPKSGRIDIVYNITEYEIAYVDKVKVRGNVKTKDIVIRRELRIKPGDRFDGDKLKRSKERLQNLGFFEDISYDTEDTQTENKKDLIVDVKESKTGAFSFGGGYSTVDQFVGFVEIEQKNFDWKNWPYFTGAGQNLKFRASFGSVSDGFDLRFTEPWLFDYPVSFGFDAYKNSHKRDSDVGYGYSESVIGGALRLGKEFTEYISGNVTYRRDQIKIGEVSDNATIELLKEVGTNVISSTTFAASFDNRDSVFEPTKGDLVFNSIECAGGPFGGDKNYIKYFGRVSHYFPLPRASVLEARGRIGMADPYGNSNEIPIYERFFAGGANTIRGYKERSIGPFDASTKDPLGGDSLLIGNLEYLYPVFSFLKAAVFYDVGNVWDKIDNIGGGGFVSGFGFGVRVKTPIGPIMLDYGIPLNKEPGEEKKSGGRFHFNISHGF
ncbi:MAG: outer membrane protein assembly factor BamA [Candidatus Omnitrophica bacterium]|nr:outer membrane protein assembly factor BamA [Candidatus Omnitrophota bacterium]